MLTSTITGTSAGSKFGQLVVQAAATLAGTLDVSTGGGFKPKAGEAFVVLKYKSHTGKFATTSGSPHYTVTYQKADAEVVYPK